MRCLVYLNLIVPGAQVTWRHYHHLIVQSTWLKNMACEQVLNDERCEHWPALPNYTAVMVQWAIFLSKVSSPLPSFKPQRKERNPQPSALRLLEQPQCNQSIRLQEWQKPFLKYGWSICYTSVFIGVRWGCCPRGHAWQWCWFRLVACLLCYLHP